ncbi:hypothetical protein SAMN00120144_0500 [Hymenobacter roseosalivarius DSM 11622]|uniref:Uncharacterized protein n=1 Tax=Hymenobacter roseosalivarius DSM 11622 TaxID=645990 RepID=A0A1W1VRF3_9BACT|nr:hypothetical protein [Hymenobacter roseosalivarius]SMB95916.1 hypothetical protein SAMN00120144_0500 [Hymenobacter roseosalivarius DSM 11622]
MSYTESRRCLLFAGRALTRGHYRRAAGRYAEVVVGLQPQADVARPLTLEAVPLVRHYVVACRGMAAALSQLEHITPAEEVLLATLSRLRRLISNLSIPASGRVLLLTEYKACFYALVEFYAAHELPERLAAYVQQHAAELQSWRRDLDLRAAAQHPN